MQTFILEQLNATFDAIAELTVIVADDRINVIHWSEESGFIREMNVSREHARQAWRTAVAQGFEEREPDDEPYLNEEEAYEAAVDHRMSRIYDAEPDWAV